MNIFSSYLQACFHSIEYNIEHAKKKWYHNLGTKKNTIIVDITDN